jgi:hypothetical protein
VAYLAFLREQQIPDADIARLTVLLDLKLFADAKYNGTYQHLKDDHIITAFVPVWRLVTATWLNRLLLHETRHFIQEAVFHEKDHEAHMCLEWKDRPHEIDAEAFAAQHEQQSIFISAKESTGNIYVRASMRNWWTNAQPVLVGSRQLYTSRSESTVARLAVRK